MTPQRAQELRAAIDRLPLATRESMLEGIQTNPIIVAADGNLRGGVCPMFASSRRPASRRPGRRFARAWDRYARARLPRAATERELLTLRSMLETSIELENEPAVSLREAIVSHQASSARSQAAREASLRAESASRPRRDAEKHDRTRRDTRERDRTRADRPRRDTRERDRTRELAGRHGWAWLRPFRSYDDYELALSELEDAAQERRSAPEEQELVSGASGRRTGG